MFFFVLFFRIFFLSGNKMQIVVFGLFFFFLIVFLSHLNQCLIQFCSCQVFVYFLISLTAKILLFTGIFPEEILFSGSRRLPLESIDADIECQLSSCVGRQFSPVPYNLRFISGSTSSTPSFCCSSSQKPHHPLVPVSSVLTQHHAH